MTDRLHVRTVGSDNQAAVEALVEERVASQLAAGDPTLWGPDAQSEAAVRLGWVDLHRSSRPLVGEVAALREAMARASVPAVSHEADESTSRNA